MTLFGKIRNPGHVDECPIVLASALTPGVLSVWSRKTKARLSKAGQREKETQSTRREVDQQLQDRPGPMIPH